jgi:hypothetical protein
MLFVEQENVSPLFQDWRMAWVAPSSFERLGFDRGLLERKAINDEEVQDLLEHFHKAARL